MKPHDGAIRRHSTTYQSRFFGGPAAVMLGALAVSIAGACGSDGDATGGGSGGAGGDGGSGDAGGTDNAAGAGATANGGSSDGGSPAEGGAGGAAGAAEVAGATGTDGGAAGTTGVAGAAGASDEGGAGGVASGSGGALVEGGAAGSSGAGGAEASGGAPDDDCGEDGEPCTAVGASVCQNGACLPCTDTTDDDACAEAYGAGNICAGGACREGCHDSSECDGQVCDSGSFECGPCMQDQDCPDDTPYCDDSDGTCLADPPPCTEENAACGSGGWCCAGTCYPGVDEDGCCSDEQCETGNCNLGTHLCARPGCEDAPEPDRFYVDSDPMPAGKFGVGSSQCPFKSLYTALANVPEDLDSTFTICTRGTFAGTNQPWPRYVPSNVELDGNYCDAVENPDHTQLLVPAASAGIYFDGEGPAVMHGYDIVRQGTADDLDYGIYVNSTPSGSQVTLYDVTIENFYYGIRVSEGNLLIQHAVDSRFNLNGLDIVNDSVVEIDVTTPTTSRSRFNQNQYYGIYAGGGVLTLRGAVYTGTGGAEDLPRTIAVSNNSTGIWVPFGSATLDHVRVASNTGTGLAVYGGADVTMTNSVLTGNNLGVHAGPSGDLSTIDLGTAESPGNNYIYGNTTSGICVSDDADGVLDAQGNRFSLDASKDCREETPEDELTHSGAICGGGVDVSHALGPETNINVENCTFEVLE